MKRALDHLRSRDPVMGSHIDRVGRCRLKPTYTATPFHALAQAITYQQLTGKAAETIWQRVLELHGGSTHFTPRNVLRHSEEELRSVGLSRSKAASLIDLARHAERRVIPGWKGLERLEDEEIVERLVSVRGIGPWTVQMLLIFSLGRKDVLPSTDYGVQKGFAILYGKESHPKPRELVEFGERWKPFRSFAAWYLWRATDMVKTAMPDPRSRKSEAESQPTARVKK